MLKISIKPWNMGESPSYILEYPMNHLGNGYSVRLVSYDAWGGYIITLIIFKHIHSDFHPESQTYFYGYKCHQLCYVIRMFNDKGKYLVLRIMVILMRW